MKLKMTALFAALTAGLLATSAYAQDPQESIDAEDRPARHHRGMPPVKERVRRMARALDLDDAQREQVRNIMLAAQPEFDALHEQRKSNRDQLQTLSADSAEIQNVAASNGELATQATLLKARVRGEIDAVLTDEQRAEFAQMKERRGERDKRRGRDRSDAN